MNREELVIDRRRNCENKQCDADQEKKGGNMKKLITLGVLSLCMSVPSFGAEHVVTHSAKIAGKDTYKAVAYSAKETGKAGKSFLKTVF